MADFARCSTSVSKNARVTPRVVRAFVVGIALGLVATGCSPPPSPVASQLSETIFTNSMKLLAASTSVEVDIQVNTAALSSDFTGWVFSDGDVDGTITETYGNGTYGPTVRIVKVGRSDYLEASASYWRQEGQTATTASSLADRWVTLDDTSTDVGSSLSLDGLAVAAIEHLVGWRDAGTGLFDGQPAVGLATADGMHHLEVSTSGPGYPIELEAAPEANRILFSNWNDGTLPSPPPAAAPSGSVRSYQSSLFAALASLVR